MRTRSRIALLIVAVSLMGIATLGNTQSSSAVSQSPWVTQTFAEQNPDLTSAFNNLPAITPRTNLPAAFEHAEITKCNVLRCLVDVPGWSTAVVIGGYDLGEPTPPVGMQGQALILHNVGEARASFGYLALGPSYVILVPYPDGRPEQLAQFTADIAGYLEQITLNPDRTSPNGYEWNNMCSVHGCNTTRIAGYLLDHGELPGARFTQYFRTDVQK